MPQPSEWDEVEAGEWQGSSGLELVGVTGREKGVEAEWQPQQGEGSKRMGGGGERKGGHKGDQH